MYRFSIHCKHYYKLKIDYAVRAHSGRSETPDMVYMGACNQGKKVLNHISSVRRHSACSI